MSRNTSNWGADGAVDRALAAFRSGEPVLIHDAADREDETDFVYPAGAITPAAVARLRHAAGGLVYVALSHAVADAIVFDRAVDQIHDHHHHLTVQPADVTCIPIATVIDANVCDQSSRMTWYDGPTVMDALAGRIESAPK